MGVVPGAGPSARRPFLQLALRLRHCLGKRRLAVGKVRSLFGFQDEAAALVKIDESAGRTVIVKELDRPLENVVVGSIVRLSGTWLGDAENLGELDQEELIIGALRRARVFPARDELRDRVSRHDPLL